jgi:SAM-dependent methyltransferase
MSTTALPRPIDPFAGSRDGRYEDDAVVVIRRASLEPQPGERWTTTTRTFRVGRERGRLVLLHALRPGSVDNDVAALLEQELFAPGWAGGADTFERLLTGVVLSCHDDPLLCWEAFYRATLDRLDVLTTLTPQPAPEGPGAQEGTLAGFAPVYRRAEELVVGARTGTLLDLGSCFGFFALRIAAGHDVAVQASDIAPGTCDLLARVSLRLGTPVPVIVCDAACVPLPDGDIDTVTLLHVLEHVDAAHGEAILREAVRLARRRVIVAVPIEREPDVAFGHVRTLDLSQLTASGAAHTAAAPWRARVEEFHGGWLVLDRLLPPARRR